jgi:hypothetical protein
LKTIQWGKGSFKNDIGITEYLHAKSGKNKTKNQFLSLSLWLKEFQLLRRQRSEGSP